MENTNPISDRITPLAPDSTLGMITHKLHYIHKGQYYTTGGMFGYVEGLAAHFKKTILAVPVAKTDNIDGLAKVECKGYEIYPLWGPTTKEFIAPLTFPYLCHKVKQAFADCDIVNVRMYSMNSLVTLGTIERMKKPVFFSLTGQLRDDPPLKPKFKNTLKAMIRPYIQSTLRRHITFVHGAHLIDMHKLKPDMCIPTYSSTYHQSQIKTTPINPPQPDKPVRLIFAGRLDSGKAVDILLKALADESISGKFKLDIVGDGSKSKEWEALSDTLGLADSVTFHGYIPHGPKFRQLMEDAHMMTFTPRHEGAPKVITEAFRFGLPVLASKVGAIPLIIRENTNGFLVEPGNVQQVIEALQKISKMEPQKWQQMSLANIELAKSYTIEETSRQIVQALIDRNLLQP